jgi:hypothetical protein
LRVGGTNVAGGKINGRVVGSQHPKKIIIIIKKFDPKVG